MNMLEEFLDYGKHNGEGLQNNINNYKFRNATVGNLKSRKQEIIEIDSWNVIVA